MLYIEIFYVKQIVSWKNTLTIRTLIFMQFQFLLIVVKSPKMPNFWTIKKSPISCQLQSIAQHLRYVRDDISADF